MKNEYYDFLTPVGRYVSGSMTEPNTTDFYGDPLVVKSGPNKGQPTQRFFFGLAIAKDNPEWGPLYKLIYDTAVLGFPSLFDAQRNCLNPDFAFKITDGDSNIPNAKQNLPCEKEGYPGHWILKFSGTQPPKCYDLNHRELVGDDLKERLKRGYFIRVQGSVSSNGELSKPGVYINYGAVQLCGYGGEIRGGVDPNEAFAEAPQLPPGASTTPIAPVGGMPGAPQETDRPAPPDNTPGPPPADNAPVPPPPAQNATQASPIVTKYLYQNVEYTEEQLLASGWDEKQILALPHNEIPF